MRKLVRCFLTGILLVGIPSQAFPQAADVKTPNEDLYITSLTWCWYGDAGCENPSLIGNIKNLNFQTARSPIIKVIWDTGEASTIRLYDLAPGDEQPFIVEVPTNDSGKVVITGYSSVSAKAMWSNR